MAEILQFRPAATGVRRPWRGDGTVIIFPGVRYERDADGNGDKAAGGNRLPAQQKSS